MGKTTSTTTSKSKKASISLKKENLTDTFTAPEGGPAVAPKPISDLLQRIGAQAKDWDEAVPEAPAPSPTKTTRAFTPTPTTSPTWLVVTGICLTLILVAQIGWFTWKTTLLTDSFDRLSTNIQLLKAEVSTWSESKNR